tara:strand:- start:10 stop:714 length:705 start_codon:yes stop_codon:yes gene_type:complete
MKLYKGDCLEVMKTIPDNSIDAIITDPPYGTTACKWDSVIDFELMWEQLNRTIKPNGAIVLFSKQPFTSVLNCSNIKNFKQELIWQKENHDNPMQAKNRFLNVIENISVFYKKKPTYNPQGVIKINKISSSVGGDLCDLRTDKPKTYTQTQTNYPKNILKFKRDGKHKHPTQKPVALMEYLIKTYTNENETVLDFTMGSGSTGVAAKNLNRNFIGIEMDEDYYNIAEQRINDSL